MLLPALQSSKRIFEGRLIMDITKGDWAHTESAFGRFNTYRGKRTGARTFVTVGIELNQVAEVHGDTDEEAEANAKLIAVAPRMAKLLEYLTTNGWNAGVSEEAREILKAAAHEI